MPKQDGGAPFSRLVLTDRDLALLETLSLKVRLLDVAQAAAWWGESRSAPSAARQRLRALEAAGYVERAYVLAHPLLEMSAPVFTWTPGQSPPDMAALAEYLQRRWTLAPVSRAVYTVTRRTAHLFGGVGGPPEHRSQATHDLHVTAVYLYLLKMAPQRAADWINADLFPPPEKQKHPDAFLRDTKGTPYLFLEFGGAYDVTHLEKLHCTCVARQLDYELW